MKEVYYAGLDVHKDSIEMVSNSPFTRQAHHLEQQIDKLFASFE